MDIVILLAFLGLLVTAGIAFIRNYRVFTTMNEGKPFTSSQRLALAIPIIAIPVFASTFLLVFVI